jgi:hypothetical protein
MNEYYIVLAGVLLRIAIPLLVLLGLALFLGRMDARWKREALRQAKDLTMISMEKPACWDSKNCSIEEKSACRAVKSDEPCWQVFRQENGNFDPNCLKCDVFLTNVAPIPETITTSH